MNKLIFQIFLFVTLILGYFIGYFGLTASVYIGFLAPYLLCLLLVVFRARLDFGYFSYVYIVFAYALFSSLVGAINGNSLREIVADFILFTSPFLAYEAVTPIIKKLGWRVTYHELIKFLGISLAIGVLDKLLDVVKFGSIVHYGVSMGFVPSPIYFAHVYKNLNVSNFKRRGVITLFILGPFFCASKTMIIINSIFFIILQFLQGKCLKVLSILFAFTSLLIISLVMEYEVYALQRFASMIETVQGVDKDASSSARMTEYNSAINILNEEGGYAYVFGKGMGAQWQTIYGDKVKGLSDGNIRNNAYHHIHIGYVVLLFRNGLVGILLYLIPVFYILSKLKIFNRSNNVYGYESCKNFKKTIFAYMIITVLGLFFGWSGFYGSVFFGCIFSIFLNFVKTQNLELNKFRS